ncbi:MAG: PHP domain-containing protein [Saprospiraceae bacterium]|nr:PHP domain-containing protein [Saprospiraceae bacterium]
MKNLFAFLLCFTIGQTLAQTTHSHKLNRAIHFPNTKDYLTLKCDFHQHSIFSDGKVHPDIRLQEAAKDSLDAVSLTEHLEYQPHKADIPHPDRNRSFELATKAAKSANVLVINGSEITRSLPPGHTNAIFIKDANKLLIQDSVEVFREANRQGAFVFWNHPNWISQRKDGIATLTDLHKVYLKEKLLHGIEVVNEHTYSDEALQIALDNNLTIMGTSDIHGLIDWEFKVAEGGHRPITMVLAKERTPEAIKEGLMNRRTIVWFNNTLIGREEHLKPLLEAAIKVEKASYIGSSSVAEVVFRNDSDAEFIMVNQSAYTLHETTDVVVLHPNATTKVFVKTLNQLADFNLKFAVLNGVTAPHTHPEMTWKVVVNN